MIIKSCLNCDFMSLLLWHGWSGGRKGIRSVKKLSGEVLPWLSVWGKVQMICIWSRWCHCHPIISCSTKIQNGLPFWCQPTQVGLGKRPLDGCSSSSKLWLPRLPAMLDLMFLFEFFLLISPYNTLLTKLQDNCCLFSCWPFLHIRIWLNSMYSYSYLAE